MKSTLRMAVLSARREFHVLADEMFGGRCRERRIFVAADHLTRVDWAWADVIVLDSAQDGWRERLWILRRLSDSVTQPVVMLVRLGAPAPFGCDIASAA